MQNPRNQSQVVIESNQMFLFARSFFFSKRCDEVLKLHGIASLLCPRKWYNRQCLCELAGEF